MHQYLTILIVYRDKGHQIRCKDNSGSWSVADLMSHVELVGGIMVMVWENWDQERWHIQNSSLKISHFRMQVETDKTDEEEKV
jgi:hypothetical protein